VFDAGVVLVVEGGDDEEDEAHEETDLLHPFSAVKFVVDEERGEVVSAKRDTNVHQIPEPASHHVTGC